jgi:hypothetical protein
MPPQKIDFFNPTPPLERISIIPDLPRLTDFISIRVAHLVVPEASLLDRHPKIRPDGSEEVPEVYACGICAIYVDVPWETWVDETY